MDEAESAAMFDRTLNLEDLGVQGNRLRRVPNITNLGKLRALYLSDNQITRIEAGSFRGASRLVVLALDRNAITFVHPSAFAPLTSMQVPQSKFAPTFSDGTPWHDKAFGAGELHAMSPTATTNGVASPAEEVNASGPHPTRVVAGCRCYAQRSDLIVPPRVCCLFRRVD